MAEYTVKLKDLMDNPQSKALIDSALSTYPLYKSTSKEEYIPSIIPTREELNNKILNYYKHKEIGFETPGRFFDELEISMNEIMPYYNQLYFSADQDFNVIYNVDYKKTIDTTREDTTTTNTTGTDNRTSEVTGTSTATSSGTSETETNSSDSSSTEAQVVNTGKNVKTTAPQDSIDIPAEQIDSVSYADEISWNKTNNSETAETSGTATSTATNSNESESSGSSSTKSTDSATNSMDSVGERIGSESTVETTKGNFGVVSAQDLVQKYREIILNIDQMIIHDKRISELFMLIF